MPTNPEQMTPNELYEFWERECERLLPQPIRSDFTLQYLDFHDMTDAERAPILARQRDNIDRLIESLVLRKSSTAQIATSLAELPPESIIVYWWRLGSLLHVLALLSRKGKKAPLESCEHAPLYSGWLGFLRASLIRR